MTIPTASTFLELRHASTARAIFVVVPERRFLAVDGIGEPGAADFQFATTALHSVADTVLQRLRRSGIATATRAGVAECLWWPAQPLSSGELPAAFAGPDELALAPADRAARAGNRD